MRRYASLPAISGLATVSRAFHSRGGGGGGNGNFRGGGGGGGGSGNSNFRGGDDRHRMQDFGGDFGSAPPQRGGQPPSSMNAGRMPPPSMSEQQQFGRRGGAPPPQYEEDFDMPPPPQRAGRGAVMIDQQMQMQMQMRGGGGGASPPQRGGRPGQRQPVEQEMEEDDEQGVMEEEEQQQPPEPPKKPEEQKLVLVEENVDGTGVTVIKLRNKPVNSLSLELFNELNAWLLWLGAVSDAKGVVLSSDIPLVFSAGLDLKEFVDCTPESFSRYWTVFQETYLILHTFPRPIVAAITGNSPAGGCVLSLCCDYRVMAKHPEGKADKPYRIGLNETKLGIVAPPWVMQSCAYVVGQRKAERMLTLGETPTAVEAEKMGLVDLAVDQAEVLPAAIKEVVKAAALDEAARSMSKDLMRRSCVELLGGDDPEGGMSAREYDTSFFVSMVTSEAVQKNLKAYMESLKNKGAAAPKKEE